MDFPPRFVGNLVPLAVMIPGAGARLMYSLDTLSWFWVPVILFALNVSANTISFDIAFAQRMAVASGATFDLQQLIRAVQHMLVTGLFQLQNGEIRRLRVSRSNQIPYIDSSAQDRLRDLLNVHEQVLMHGVSDWIQHLYYCEVILLQGGQGQLYDADPWLRHDFTLNGQRLHIAQPNRQVQVTIPQNYRTDRSCQYTRNQIIADISALPVADSAGRNDQQRNPRLLQRASRGDLLALRRQLINTVAPAVQQQ